MSLTTKKSWEKHAFLTRSSSQDCKNQAKQKHILILGLGKLMFPRWYLLSQTGIKETNI